MADTIKLPPLPPHKRRMLCTKCGYHGLTEATDETAYCERCSYMAFVSDVPYTDAELRARDIAVARAALDAAAEAWDEYEDEETRATTFIRNMKIEGEAP